MMIIIDNYDYDKINFSSIIIDLSMAVLNFLFFFSTMRFHKYKKAFFCQYRLKVDLVL